MNCFKNKSFVFGRWIDSSDQEEMLASIQKRILSGEKINLSVSLLLDACEKFVDRIYSKDDCQLLEFKQEIVEFCSRVNLEKKLRNELGKNLTLEHSELFKQNVESDEMEGWYPLGTLFHVTPSNSPLLSFFALIEGLLAGNINIVKKSSRDSDLILELTKQFIACDDSQQIVQFVAIVNFASSDTKFFMNIVQYCDAVSAWGGDKAIKEIQNMVPPSIKVIPWGHKISLAFLSQESWSTVAAKKSAELCALDIVTVEQQACSSPQMIYLENATEKNLTEFAHLLGQELEVWENKKPRSSLELAEQSEITNTVLLHDLVSLAQDKMSRISDNQNKWHVLIDVNSHPKASPLNRTIWLKAVSTDAVAQTLFPIRKYMQSIMLACSEHRIFELSEILIRSGANRIVPLGRSLESYHGAPHDGEYALTRFMKRVSLQFPQDLRAMRSGQFTQVQPAQSSKTWPIMTKSDFQMKEGTHFSAKLFFKSGGSSGTPALSGFTYEDYYAQMRAAAEGLYAAGLDAKYDKVANLFFGGGLYGGLISFFTVLEFLEARQFPFAAHYDFKFVAEMIVSQKINCLLGMPSYLMQLFSENEEFFMAHRGIVDKIFYGGEHFNQEQRTWFKEKFGIANIKSATYGSVDAGPIGYQCFSSSGSIHHLHNNLHQLEIVQTDLDKAVEGNEVGRLLITTPSRKGALIRRYEIGDVGRWVDGPCPCGRSAPRFELLGRLGDYFRVSGTFINYQKLANIFIERCQYSGELQIEIGKQGLLDSLTVYVDGSRLSQTEDQLKTNLLESYGDLNELVILEKSLVLSLTKISQDNFKRTPGSGKLIRVRDLR